MCRRPAERIANDAEDTGRHCQDGCNPLVGGHVTAARRGGLNFAGPTIYFHETLHYAEIERLAKTRLSEYRITGRTGRPTEWLKGITANQVSELVRQLAQSIQPALLATEVSCKTTDADHPVEIATRPALISPSQIVGAAHYLVSNGMHLDLLRELHHSSRRTETFQSTISYFSKKSDIRDKNIVYGARLAYVASEHQKTGRAFDALVKDALQRYPTDA